MYLEKFIGEFKELNNTFNKAKDLARIPRSQQATRHW